jgi:hypothetical protein
LYKKQRRRELKNNNNNNNADPLSEKLIMILHTNAIILLWSILLSVTPIGSFTVETSHFQSRSTELYSSKPGRNSSKQPDGPSAWDKLKGAFYGTADGVGGLAKKVKESKEQTQPPPAVVQSYSDFEDAILDDDAKLGPGKRLVKQYQLQTSALGVNKPVSPSSASSAGTLDKKSSKPKVKAFDVFKETIYSTLESKDKKKTFFANEVTPSISSATVDRAITPIARPSIQSSLPDLNSPNPIKRFQAERRIEEEEPYERAERRKRNNDELKQNIYMVADAVSSAIEAAPGAVVSSRKAVTEIGKYVKTVPTKVDTAVARVKTIPDIVQGTVIGTKASINSGIETTKQVVQDVQEFPSKVSQKVEDIQFMAKKTINSVDESFTSLKVLVGIEKPKPKPPAPPKILPRKKELAERAGSVAFSLAGGMTKLVFYAGKGITTAAWESAESAFGPFPVPELPPQLKAIKEFKMPELPSPLKALKAPPITALPSQLKAASPIQPPEAKKTDANDDLDREVEEALRSAEDSLEKSRREKENPRKD